MIMNSNMLSYNTSAASALSNLYQRDVESTFEEEGDNIFYPQEDASWSRASDIKTSEYPHTSVTEEALNSKPKRYLCEYCPQSFAQISNLKRHEKVHTGERPHICEQCQRRFSTYSNLKQHEQVHQESDNRKRFCCKYCPRTYYYHSSLKKHIKLHRNVKVSTETSESVEKNESHEYELAIRKQVHTHHSNTAERSTEMDTSKTEGKIEACFDMIPESESYKNKTQIDSPAVTLTLSLLTQKLDLLKELHQLKIAQLQKLQNTQDTTEKSGPERLERQEEEAILLQMLIQVSKNCTLAFSQPEISQKCVASAKKNKNTLRLNTVSTEPSQECSTNQSKLNKSSGSSSPRSVSSMKMTKREAFPTTFISQCSSLEASSPEKDPTVNENLFKFQRDSSPKLSENVNQSGNDCDSFFADFNQCKNRPSGLQGQNEGEILPLAHYETLEREMSEFKNFFELKGANFHQESFFSLNLAS